jgi:putative metallohydrolase (TIGR04338 family)
MKKNWEAAIGPQAQAVYAAEEYAWNASRGKALPKVSDIENFLSQIFESRWFKGQFPRAYGFEVLDGRGATYASGKLVDGVCKISVPRALRCELFVLHELSHAVGAPNHGPLFCSCYLKLVRRFISPTAARVLRFDLKAAGAKLRRPSSKIQCDDYDCEEVFWGPVPYFAGPRTASVSPPWQQWS